MISEAQRQRLATPAETPQRQPLDTQTLDTLAPERTYKALKSEKIELVPDQTGDCVYWYSALQPDTSANQN
jgi:hypothetical protein